MDRTSLRSTPAVSALLLTLALGLPLAASAAPGDLAALGARPLDQVEILTLPPVDAAALLAADLAAAGPGVPLKFAEPLPVFSTPATRGNWETLADGSELWRLRVESSGAVSLSLGFTRYVMPDGGSLVVRAPDGSTVLGPYASRDNKAHGELWTPLVPGDEAVIEVVLPAGRRPRLELELTSVNHGYRDLARLEKSGACNIDVVCPQGDAFDPQIRSVARIIIGGASLCTGFMVNNTAQDLAPYFMTADHCGVNAINDASLVVLWNYFNSTCRTPGGAASGMPGNGSESQTQTGATFLADSAVSDFTLVELDDPPPLAYDVHWVGWDARATDPSEAVAVHHPQGDEKRISFEDDPTSTTSYLGSSAPGDGTHIRVADWDEGTTEGGSSGSPLFDQNGRAVGQLHGGFAACGNDDPDWYGRISVSWGLGLSDWLDPGATGALFLDGRDAAPPTFPGLIVPGFEVDVANATGPTTFFAVRNTAESPVELHADYYAKTVTGTPLRTDVFTLGPRQTLSRDVRSNLTGLAVADGFATGLIVLSEGGSGKSNLVGDYFRIDSDNDFATGDRLVDPGDFCPQQEIRYVDFGSGSQLQILVNDPQAEAQPSFHYTATNQAGVMVGQGDYFTSENLTTIAVEELVAGQNFGTLSFDFSTSGGGYVTAKYSAFGRFSVELNGTCRAQAPSLSARQAPAAAVPPGLRLAELGSTKGVKDTTGVDRALKACADMFLSCNTMVSSVLTADDCALEDGTVVDFWLFSGSAGQTVTIDMTSSDFDTFLFLLDPVPEVVATDDDGGTGTNSRIVHTLGASGTWAIAANNFFPDDIGNYSLTLACDGGMVSLPAAPSNLTAMATSSTEILLLWQDNSDNETAFRVELKVGGGSFTDIGSVGANAVGAEVSGLVPDTAYTFRVRARNAAGDSAYTNEASATTLADLPALTDTSGLIVPGFEVEVANADGPTTFFAVRNTAEAATDVHVTYHGEEITDTPLRTDVFTLGPRQTLTANVRTDLTGLTVTDGFATGLVVITENGDGAPNLEGDYFRIDSANDFASGDRLVGSDDLCAHQEIRFVDFGSGSLLQILLDEPQGPGTPSFSYTAYNQAGTLLTSGDFGTSRHLNVLDVDDLVPGQSFGTLVFDFSSSGSGFATAKYSAFGRFSVELNGACRP